jgi:hypothetical protein
MSWAKIRKVAKYPQKHYGWYAEGMISWEA